MKHTRVVYADDLRYEVQVWISPTGWREGRWQKVCQVGVADLEYGTKIAEHLSRFGEVVYDSRTKVQPASSEP